jgi:hypothetical protein
VAAVGCKTLTGGVRLSARAGDGAAEWIWWAGAGPIGEAGRAAAVVWVSFFFFFLFLFQIQILVSKPNKLQTNSEFKPRFESSNQKQCTSMHATVNSYISLIN